MTNGQDVVVRGFLKPISTLRKPLESVALCGAILAREPRHAVAAHLLGLALKDTGDWAQGGLRWGRWRGTGACERAGTRARGVRDQCSESFAKASPLLRHVISLIPGAGHRPESSVQFNGNSRLGFT